MFFFCKKILFEENEPQKSRKLKKMLRKSPALNLLAANFKNAVFFIELFKRTNMQIIQ